MFLVYPQMCVAGSRLPWTPHLHHGAGLGPGASQGGGTFLWAVEFVSCFAGPLSLASMEAKSCPSCDLSFPITGTSRGHLGGRRGAGSPAAVSMDGGGVSNMCENAHGRGKTPECASPVELKLVSMKTGSVSGTVLECASDSVSQGVGQDCLGVQGSESTQVCDRRQERRVRVTMRPHVCCASASPGPGASGTQRRSWCTPGPLPAPCATPAAPLWVRSLPQTNQLGDPLTERPIVNRRLSAAPTGPPPPLALCFPAPHQSSGGSAAPRTPGAPVAKPSPGPSSLSAPRPHAKPSAETQDQSLARRRGLVPA
ncbi:neurturin isoform X1 [Leptonychotes weddellii]|uniref:Neurturin isoform X1 n=1 Tax=Leptonychotes weddellii TaxID=9713 RepID=A0A7F8Q3D3_LEPWE|nr:neurturin isoform X1 [Leptonychotes weddellii]